MKTLGFYPVSFIQCFEGLGISPVRADAKNLWIFSKEKSYRSKKMALAKVEPQPGLRPCKKRMTRKNIMATLK